MAGYAEVPLSKQLTLSVGLKDHATFANYFSKQNAELVSELRRLVAGEGERVIYLYGSGGMGCTHLAQACCHYANEFNLSSIYLPLNSLFSISPKVLEGLENLPLVCIDDIQTIVGNQSWEEAFLYFYNRLLAAGGRLVIAAKAAPKSLKLILADVASRLSAGVVYALQPLSDEEKLQALIKRAELRGLILSEEVANYILTHCPRHMTTLFSALEILDKESLATKRRPTIPFVKEVLEII
ncbi:MAG TPA: DnaA regulatory inactivator Hda [Gammaproteobacteria bacterium]|nr:DnaA regulatory inactivator Hda [Gammaproteobacteria bacterium]